MMKQCYIIDMPVIGDDRGSLIAIESLKNIPFSIQRVYYIFNTAAGVVRGKHAHKKLQQILLCVSGSCTIRNFDGYDEKICILNSPNKGLYIGQNIWREMYDFSPDCVLLVLADAPYDEQEYVRDYNAFLTMVKNESHESSEIVYEKNICTL